MQINGKKRMQRSLFTLILCFIVAKFYEIVHFVFFLLSHHTFHFLCQFCPLLNVTIRIFRCECGQRPVRERERPHSVISFHSIVLYCIVLSKHIAKQNNQKYKICNLESHSFDILKMVCASHICALCQHCGKLIVLIKKWIF